MLLVAFSATPVLVMLFYRHPMFLLYLFLISYAFDAVFPEYYFLAGGFMLFPTDVAYFFTITTLAMCAWLRPRKIAAALKENVFLSMFLALIVLYVVLYTPVYAQSAVGEARKYYFIFLIPLLAAVAIKNPTDLQRFVVAIVWAAVAIAVVGLSMAVAKGTIIRGISAQAALALVLAAFVMLIHRIYKIVLVGPTLDKLLLWLFFTATIIVSHRTVWLAMGSGLLLMFWLYCRKQALLAKVILSVFVTTTAIGAGIVLFPNTAARLETKFQGILEPEKDANASWRMERWQQHLERLSQDGNLLFGEGFGSYYGQDEAGLFMPDLHSGYIQLILKFGVAGLILYGVLAFKFMRDALAVRKILEAGPMRASLESGILAFGAAHVYSSGYGFDLIMLMFFAVANSAARLAQHGSVDFRAPGRQHVRRYTNSMPAYLSRGLSARNS
jgi:hypothetical protein